MGQWYADPWTMGDRFRKAREHLGLDQGAFAELIGVSRNTVSHYESGVTTHPIPVIVYAWAAATGTTAEWLRDGIVAGADNPGEAFIPRQRAPAAAA